MALGTPVLNIEIHFEMARFAGLRELSHLMTVEEFLASDDYDIHNPWANPEKYLDIRESLIRTCTEFTGYGSGTGFLNGRSLLDLLADSDLIQETVTGFNSNREKFT